MDRSPVAGISPEPPIYRIEMHVFRPGGGGTYEAAVKSLVKGLGLAGIKLPSWDFSVANLFHDRPYAEPGDACPLRG
ncbi:MAG TPA: hypothetical protein VGD62_13400 [Acidobacteriaceae bacterium]